MCKARVSRQPLDEVRANSHRAIVSIAAISPGAPKLPSAKQAQTRRLGRTNLQFAHAAKISGFRSSGLSAYNNVDPHTVVRELVQNALDAAMAAGREVVRVNFEIDEVRTTDVPALAQYREHLACAIDTQREKHNLEQAQSIVDAMEAAVTSERLPVLCPNAAVPVMTQTASNCAARRKRWGI